MTLNNLKTGEVIRNATESEAQASRSAALTDGGIGAIVVDDITCYVSE